MSEGDEVLILGGGTVGLATAAMLGFHGVQATVVERHESLRSHPRATGVGQRTAEIFRQLGLQDALDDASVDLSRSVGSLTVDTLQAAVAEADVEAVLAALPPEGVSRPRSDAAGPVLPLGTCPQDRLDRILLAAARERGAQVRFGKELVNLRQRADHVEVTLSGPAGTARHSFAYLIAADGANGQTRQRIGIPADGPGELGDPLVNIYFRADLSALTRGIRFVACTITHPDAEGTLVTIDAHDHWVFHTPYQPNAGQRPEDFTDTRCVDLIRSAIGVPDLEVEIIDVLPWQVTARVAGRFNVGRVFLVGDAAHTIPPIGAFGMNTGIADAHNLAWKIAYVLSGRAGSQLLCTYSVERQPVAVFTLDQAMLRLANPRLHWDRSPVMAEARARVGAANAPVVQLGYRYDSTAVIDAQPAIPSLEDITADLDGAPGSRIPHLWVQRDGRQFSTLDLVGRNLTLFTGSDAAEWRSPGSRNNVDVDVVTLDELANPDESARLGIDPDGAILARPDGFIAWRQQHTPADPAPALHNALRQILATPT